MNWSVQQKCLASMSGGNFYVWWNYLLGQFCLNHPALSMTYHPNIQVNVTEVSYYVSLTHVILIWLLASDVVYYKVLNILLCIWSYYILTTIMYILKLTLTEMQGAAQATLIKPIIKLKKKTN